MAYNECRKEDNQKKLYCNQDSQERVIFIPIEFSFDAGQYITWLLDSWEYFDKITGSKIEENQVPHTYRDMFYFVDIVFICQLFWRNKKNQLSFSLLKITKQNSFFVFEKSFYKHPYNNLSMMKNLTEKFYNKEQK